MAETTLRANVAKCIDQGDYNKVVAAAEKLLHQSKGDLYGLHVKCVALLQLGRPAQAIPVAQELVAAVTKAAAAPDALTTPNAARFLLATAHYRVGDFATAESTIETVPEQSRDAGMLNLLAQARYNLHRYTDAAAVYQQLVSQRQYRDEAEKEELLINLTACLAMRGADAECLALARNEGVTNHSDVMFNVATALVQARKFDDAAKALNDAEGLCLATHGLPRNLDFAAATVESAGGDADAFEDFVRDAAAVKVQQAYVRFSQGDESGAESALNGVLNTHASQLEGTATHATASLLLTALRRHTAFVDSHRRLREMQAPSIARRLTQQQREAAAYNNFLLSLGVGKIAQARSLAEAMVRDFPTGDLGARALAAVLARSDPRRAEATLQSALQKAAAATAASASASDAAATSVRNGLVMAQLALERGDVNGALAVAEANPALLCRPAVLAIVMAAARDVATVQRIASTPEVQSLIRSNGNVAFIVAHRGFGRLEDHQTAATMLEAALKLPQVTAAQHKTWTAAAAFHYARGGNSARAQQLLAGTPAPAAAQVPLAQLERAALPKDALAAKGYARPTSSTAPVGGAAANGGVCLPVARSRPRRHVPADTSAPIDPERWIPWSTRTYVKDMPPRRKQEARRRRADEQEMKRKAAERRKQEAAAAAAAAAAPQE